MVQEQQKNENKAISSLKTSIYAIYDSALKQFEPPFSCQDSHIDDFMRVMVNDVQSRYYNHETDFILNRIAEFSQDTGILKQLTVIERIKFLDSYIDNSKRKLQTITQTLNYLPTGYFKMSEEQQKTIQEKIDSAIVSYVSQYVIPDIDTSKLDMHSEDLKKVINESFN